MLTSVFPINKYTLNETDWWTEHENNFIYSFFIPSRIVLGKFPCQTVICCIYIADDTQSCFKATVCGAATTCAEAKTGGRHGALCGDLSKEHMKGHEVDCPSAFLRVIWKQFIKIVCHTQDLLVGKSTDFFICCLYKMLTVGDISKRFGLQGRYGNHYIC